MIVCSVYLRFPKSIQTLKGIKDSLLSYTGRCQFSSSGRKSGLSDPLKPSKESYNKEVKDFVNEKNKSSSAKVKVVEKDSILGRMFQSTFNPKPLNVKIREDFNLKESYKLVYIMPNERTTLIINACGFLLFPTIFAVTGLLLFAELTGRSQFSQSFDNPLPFFAFIFAWCGIMLVATIRLRSTTVARIYYDKESDKFALFRSRGLLGFKREDFEPKNFILRSDPRARKLETRFTATLTKFHGNVLINNRLRQIDFNQFSSDNVIEKLVGSDAFKRLKNTNN